jgi:hypothetical protein
LCAYRRKMANSAIKMAPFAFFLIGHWNDATLYKNMSFYLQKKRQRSAKLQIHP